MIEKKVTVTFHHFERQIEQYNAVLIPEANPLKINFLSEML